MRLTILFTAILCVQASARGIAQNISLHESNKPVEVVLQDIEKQSGYTFFYNVKDMPRETVNINVTGSIDEVLKEVLKGMPLDYRIVRNNIVLTKKKQISSVPAVESVSAPQPIVITGKVTDTAGNAMQGVSVTVKGTKTGTTTDVRGYYSIAINDKQGVLVFSSIGYEKMEMRVGAETAINVVLHNRATSGDDVVVIGYVAQKKDLFTGAVSTVTVNQGMTEEPVNSAADLLTGRIAGVNVTTNAGEPGTQNSVTIRTASSWNSQPVLFVIDGMVSDAATFQNLAPNEIESLTVLKDGASAAIYGVRSDGGVIVVTTKHGKLGTPTINYTANYSGNYPTQQVPLTNLYQEGLMTNQMYANINSQDPRVPAAAPQGTAWSPQELAWAQSLPGKGYDALKAVWNTPFVMTHGLSISGGSEKVRYFAAASYFDNGGFLASTDYKKWNVRLNVTADITSSLQLYAALAMTSSYLANAPVEGTDATYEKLRVSFNTFPVYSNQGDRYMTTGWAYGNPSAEANGYTGYQHTNFIQPTANVSLTYKLPYVQGLSFKAAFYTDWRNNHFKEAETHNTFWFPILSGANNHIVDANDADLTTTFTNTNFWGLYSTSSWQNDYQFNLQANYNRTFGEHHINAAVVYERAQSSYSSMWNESQGFPVYQTDQYWAANSDHNDMWSGGGPDYSTGRASYVGQVNYDYASKYLLNASLREDGSMYFAPNERWGWFPAASAGWVMSKENFLADNRLITNLKLRASVSLTGNDAVVSGWQWQQIYQTGTSYYFGNTPSTNVGIGYGPLVNPNLTWEKSLGTNIGFDYELIHHLSGSFNYYRKHTYDILGTRQNTLPTTFSRTMPQENYGIIDAQGYELSVGWHDRIRSVNWFAILNASYGWNKVVSEDYPISDLPWQVPVGKTTNYIAGYTSSIIRSASQLAAWKNANPNYINPGNGNTAVGLGSMVYADAGGPKGVPDGNINTYDEKVLYANPNPVNFGLDLGGSWKGFTLEAVFNGMLHNPRSFFEMADYYEGQMFNTRWINQSYTTSNPNAPLPMWVPREYRSYSVSNSSFWYQDASFIRLSKLNLGYTFQFKNPLGNAIRSFRVFTSATNLFYISDFKWWDPQFNPGWSGVNYPIMRTFSGGVNVNF